jgi:hypothetical protein
LWAAATLAAEPYELTLRTDVTGLCEITLRTDVTDFVDPKVPDAADTPTAAINMSVAAVMATTTSLDSPFNPRIRAGYRLRLQGVKLLGP